MKIGVLKEKDSPYLELVLPHDIWGDGREITFDEKSSFFLGYIDVAIEKPKEETVEVEIATSPIGLYSAWTKDCKVFGTDFGVKTRKATIKFHD